MRLLAGAATGVLLPLSVAGRGGLPGAGRRGGAHRRLARPRCRSAWSPRSSGRRSSPSCSAPAARGGGRERASRPAGVARSRYDGRVAARRRDLDVAAGEWVALVGPERGGQDVAAAGARRDRCPRPATVGGRRPSAGAGCRGGAGPRLVAVVPQSPVLPAGMTVAEYVLLGPHAAPRLPRRRPGRRDVDCRPTRWSGSTSPGSPTAGSGSVRRRAAAGGAGPGAGPGAPRSLLLDEPTSALDIGHQQQVLDLVDAPAAGSGGLAVVAAMHDLTLAAQYADALVLLHRGHGRRCGVGGRGAERRGRSPSSTASRVTRPPRTRRHRRRHPPPRRHPAVTHERLRPLMVQGVLVVGGEELADDGAARVVRGARVCDVAPYKAQNMSNNARVVDGGEIGVAQWLQARAAGVVPDVRMNPVLVKPEADDAQPGGGARTGRPGARARCRGGSGTTCCGRDGRARSTSLQAEHELVVIEGAGQPGRDEPAATSSTTARPSTSRAPDAARQRHRPRRLVRPSLRHVVARPPSDA